MSSSAECEETGPEIMEFNSLIAHQVAQEYIGTSEQLTTLGWGISGYVFLSPDYRTAIKVHKYPESYSNELLVYRKLRRLRLTHLHGLSIPKLRGSSDRLRCIHMDAVKAPFLLDFAAARFSPPDFSPEVMENWHREIAQKFGQNTDIVYAVYNSLQQYEIYYMDFRQSNLNPQGLPGFRADRSDSELDAEQ